MKKNECKFEINSTNLKGKNENEQEKENDENMTNQTFAIPENFSNKKRKLQDESEIKPKPDSNCSPSDYKLPLPDFITSSPVSTNTPNTRYSKRKRTSYLLFD